MKWRCGGTFWQQPGEEARPPGRGTGVPPFKCPWAAGGPLAMPLGEQKAEGGKCWPASGVGVRKVSGCFPCLGEKLDVMFLVGGVIKGKEG